MARHATAVAGVIYPGVEPFLEDFVNSLKKQTCTAFDLIIYNDGADESLKGIFPPETFWLDCKQLRSVAQIREYLIGYAKREYSQLIFADTDDYFSANRVAESVRWLKSYDFVFNEVSLVDKGGGLMKPEYFTSLGVPDELTDSAELEDGNVVGLSSSAVNLRQLPELKIPADSIAVDWWIFTLLLIKGCRGKFLRDAVTFYRQHDANTIGMKERLTEARLKLGLQVKKIHYRNLVTYCKSIGRTGLEDRFGEKLSDVTLLESLAGDLCWCQQYLEKVNANYSIINHGWWSDIISIDRLEYHDK